MITIRANGINSLRKKADRTGTSSFDIFYQGIIDIECDQQKIQEEILADYWNQLERSSKNSTISCLP